MSADATFFTNSRTTSSREYALAALNLSTAPSAAVNCATHIGTRTDIWPPSSAVAAIVRAVPPVTQPPQINPIAIVVTTPKAIPWRKRVRASPCKTDGIFMLSTSIESCRDDPTNRRASRRERIGTRLISISRGPSDGANSQLPLQLAMTSDSHHFMDSSKDLYFRHYVFGQPVYRIFH